ncbi:MAG: hypothetical protein R3C10_06420 [Pirellulales bacterium]
MGTILLIVVIALANLALGAAIAIGTGAAPPLREIIDACIYEAGGVNDPSTAGQRIDDEAAAS